MRSVPSGVCGVSFIGLRVRRPPAEPGGVALRFASAIASRLTPAVMVSAIEQLAELADAISMRRFRELNRVNIAEPNALNRRPLHQHRPLRWPPRLRQL